MSENKNNLKDIIKYCSAFFTLPIVKKVTEDSIFIERMGLDTYMSAVLISVRATDLAEIVSGMLKVAFPQEIDVEKRFEKGGIAWMLPFVQNRRYFDECVRLSKELDDAKKKYKYNKIEKLGERYVYGFAASYIVAIENLGEDMKKLPQIDNRYAEELREFFEPLQKKVKDDDNLYPWYEEYKFCNCGRCDEYCVWRDDHERCSYELGGENKCLKKKG